MYLSWKLLLIYLKRSLLLFIDRMEIVFSIKQVILRSTKCIIWGDIYPYLPYNGFGISPVPLELGPITLDLFLLMVIPLSFLVMEENLLGHALRHVHTRLPLHLLERLYHGILFRDIPHISSIF